MAGKPRLQCNWQCASLELNYTDRAVRRHCDHDHASGLMEAFVLPCSEVAFKRKACLWYRLDFQVIPVAHLQRCGGSDAAVAARQHIRCWDTQRSAITDDCKQLICNQMLHANGLHSEVCKSKE